MSFSCLGPKSTPLHKIARKGNEHELLGLLRQGADVTARDAEGRTPLHLAVMRGHMAIIKGLLEHGGPAVLLSRDILNCTPVHLAAVQNQVQLISMLIAALLEDTSGCTPLHEVARRGCMQDFLGFLHLGWDIAACDGRNQEVLQLTEDASKSGFGTVKQILGWSALHLAAMEGKVSNIEKLIKKFNCDVHCQSSNTWSPLHYAAAYNQVGSIEALVRLGAKVDVRDSVGSTPLHVACGEGHLPAVVKLIELGADPAAKDKDGCTPLYCAAAWNRIEVVKKLHVLGCPSWVQSEEGRTAVHVAAEQGWVDLIRVLVRELDCRVDSTDKYKFTPLHSAANWGWVNAISILVDLDHAVDVKDCHGRTPLHYASLHGRTGAIERLFDLGAKLKECDARFGYTPLHLAADSGQCEAVAKLIELGADTEAKTISGRTCLQLATVKGPGNVDVIGLLVELGASLKPVTDDQNIETPLHIAARAGRRDIVLKLINHGAKVSARTKDGSTPLHYAAAFGQSQVIESLVKAGCAVNGRDNAKNTPLHLAAGCGFLDAVIKLFELGAELDARDMSDCTPLQNTAHGTYSALAPVPSGVSASPNGSLQELGSLSLRRPGLSSAVLPKGNREESSKLDGMVPVRTGFAWAALGPSETLSNMCLNDLDRAHSPSSCRSNNWKGADLMSLLRKATRGHRSGSLFLNPDAALDCHKCDDVDRGPCPRHRHREDDESDCDKWSHRDFEREKEGIEFLLKKTEALQMSTMEQDRSRLLPVAEKLVELGADIGARDNEGRTALHLAAGCGDKLMVLKLVELGADVNSRDSVGGTAMHHAAMANKKEMMFTLALLGCDWRAKAEGIDGASPAFVLCGQHGKTNRQQKLLEAKLKRVYMGGEARRKSEQEVLEEVWAEATARQEDYKERAKKADANMAALLEEVEAEAAAAKNKKSSSRRKQKKQSGKSSDLENSNPKKNPPQNSKKSEAFHHEQDSTACEGKRNAIKAALDEAVSCANFVLEIGSVAGHDAMMDVKEKMDQAIANACIENVGAKYARKVRKKLQMLIDASPSDSPEINARDGDRSDMKGSTGQKSNQDDDDGWVPAQCRGRKQSAQRNSAHHAETVKNPSSASPGWQSSGQKPQTTVLKPLAPSPVKSGAMTKTANSGAVCTPQLMEETERMVLASIPKPSEKAVIQHKIDAENEAALRSGGGNTVVKNVNLDSTSTRNARPVWEQSQKAAVTASVYPLADPDFPPLQSSMTSYNPPAVLHLCGKSASRKADSDRLSVSQDSVSTGAKTETTDPVSVGGQSPMSESRAVTKSVEHSTEIYPQYELFGSSASPALSTRVLSERSDSSKQTSMFDSMDAYPPALGLTPASSSTKDMSEQGIASPGRPEVMHQTEAAPYPMHCGGTAMPAMYMSASYPSMNHYGSARIPSPVYPVMPMHPSMNGETVPQYMMYSTPPCPTPAYRPSPASKPLYSTDHCPAEPVALRVAMQCLNADEIADRLPKEIPGLVESDTEEPPMHRRPRKSERILSSGSPVESPGILPRHLLGELASELEA